MHVNALYVFLAECDPRGLNSGSWVLRPKTRQWVDPFGIFHLGNNNTLGYADGHVAMQAFREPELIDWNMEALEGIPPFSFYRTPKGDVELEDFQNMLDGYAYKKLQ